MRHLIELRDAARSLGVVLEEPFLQLAFLALPVIPALKITDRGMVDVMKFEIHSRARCATHQISVALPPAFHMSAKPTSPRPSPREGASPPPRVGGRSLPCKTRVVSQTEESLDLQLSSVARASALSPRSNAARSSTLIRARIWSACALTRSNTS